MTLADFETAPVRVSRSMQLAATPAAIFDELGHDPSLWLGTIRRSVWRTGATGGVGAQREVDVVGFGRFRELMIAWERPHRIAFTMIASTSRLVAQLAEDWFVEPDAEGARVTWRIAARTSALGRPLTPVLRASVLAMFYLARSGLAKRTAWSAGRVRGKHAV
jgi:hypothetical protein